MIVVDTSVWMAFLKRMDTDPVRKLKTALPRTDILVGDLVPLEILQRARDPTHASRLEVELRRANIVEMLDTDIAVQAAASYRRLRTLGITVRKTADLIVATFCIAEGHALLHDDRDFLPSERHLGLRCL